MQLQDIGEYQFIFIVLAAFFWWKAAYHYLIKRKIKDTARSKIATAPQGLIEVEGFAWPKNGTTVTSTDLRAVHYDFKLEELVQQGSGKNRKKKWVTVYKTLFAEPFFIYDGTAVAEIESVEAEYEETLITTRYWQEISMHERQRIINEIVKGAIPGLPLTKGLLGLSFGTGKWRIVESKILVGSPVYARGTFQSFKDQPESIHSVGLTDFANRVFDPATKRAKKMHTLMDDNKDQFVDAHEAEKGYGVIGHLAFKTSLAKKLPEKEFPFAGVMLSEPEHKLYVAGAHEEQLSHNLLKKAQQSAAIALAFTVVVGLQSNDRFMKKLGEKLSAAHKYGVKLKRSPSSK